MSHRKRTTKAAMRANPAPGPDSLPVTAEQLARVVVNSPPKRRGHTRRPLIGRGMSKALRAAAVLLLAGCSSGHGQADDDTAVAETLTAQTTAAVPASTLPPTTTMSLDQCLRLAYAFDIWDYDLRDARKRSADAAAADNWPLADRWTEIAEEALVNRNGLLQEIQENDCTWKPGVQAAMHSSPDPWDTP